MRRERRRRWPSRRCRDCARWRSPTSSSRTSAPTARSGLQPRAGQRSSRYVSFVMRADNEGEGGIMALTALVQRALSLGVVRVGALVALGVFGASLFYGDSVITPAISVLSAVEGLTVVSPALEHA